MTRFKDMAAMAFMKGNEKWKMKNGECKLSRAQRRSHFPISIFHFSFSAIAHPHSALHTAIGALITGCGL
jgi:hypothetical protein